MIAPAVYLLMLFILLPIRRLRYLLPFCLIVGWSVSGYLVLFRRPPVRAVALVALFAHRVALVLPRRRLLPRSRRRSPLSSGSRQTVRTPSSFPIHFCGMPTFIGAKAKRDRSQSLKPIASNSGTSSRECSRQVTSSAELAPHRSRLSSAMPEFTTSIISNSIFEFGKSV
jgi:hypothetical protein